MGSLDDLIYNLFIDNITFLLSVAQCSVNNVLLKVIRFIECS